jgi:hypothetical protein
VIAPASTGPAPTTTTTTTTVVTTATPTPTGTVTLATATLKVKRRNGATVVRLSCAGTAPVCSGQIVLVRMIPRKGRIRAHTVTLAKVSFSIRAGTTASVTLHLSAAARSTLRSAHGHLTALLRLVRSSPTPSQTQQKPVRLVQVP